MAAGKRVSWPASLLTNLRNLKHTQITHFFVGADAGFRYAIHSVARGVSFRNNLMDRALQERVIGAIVLVIAAVLIVPVFLDGPANDSDVVSQVVTLPGQNDQKRSMHRIVLDRDRTVPMPGNALSSTPESGPATAPQGRSDVAASTRVASPTATESSTGMWAVQLGSFSNQENAERLAADLRNQGYAAFLSKLETGSGALHRVRIGPQKDRDGAESVAAQLSQSGHAGQVVPHP